MAAFLLTPPAIEPVSLAEAKDFLRVEHDDDNDVVAALIASARIRIEVDTRRALMAQNWRLVRDCWPQGGVFALLPAPVRTVSAVRIFAAGGEWQVLESGAFALDMSAAPGRLSFVAGAPPAPARPFAGIEIDIEAGYGEAAADVPQPLRHAIRLLVAHWYENRALVAASGEVAAVPASVVSLIVPYRVLSL